MGKIYTQDARRSNYPREWQEQRVIRLAAGKVYVRETQRRPWDLCKAVVLQAIDFLNVFKF